MDNFRLDLTSAGLKSLAAGLSLFDKCRITGYSERVVNEQPHLVFYWAKSDDQKVHNLPFEMNAEMAANFAAAWLLAQDYGVQPDHDGHNSKGFRMFNEAWGHVFGDWRAFVAIAPEWAMHGK